MHKEYLPLQIDMFTGESVDTRTEAQKRRDRERVAPQQQMLFRGVEIFEFGGRPRSMHQDWLDSATPLPLDLKFRDIRTPEEIERAERQAAQEHMRPLFPVSDAKESEEMASLNCGIPTSNVGFDRERYTLIKGLKAQLRAHHISRIVRF